MQVLLKFLLKHCQCGDIPSEHTRQFPRSCQILKFGHEFMQVVRFPATSLTIISPAQPIVVLPVAPVVAGKLLFNAEVFNRSASIPIETPAVVVTRASEPSIVPGIIGVMFQEKLTVPLPVDALQETLTQLQVTRGGVVRTLTVLEAAE